MASDRSPIAWATVRAAAQRPGQFRIAASTRPCQLRARDQLPGHAVCRSWEGLSRGPLSASAGPGGRRLSPARACDAIAPGLRPTDDTLTSSLGTAERVFSKPFAVFFGLRSPRLGCDNSRGLFACFSLSPPHCDAHATPCLSTRSVKRCANLLCTLIKSVQDVSLCRSPISQTWL